MHRTTRWLNCLVALASLAIPRVAAGAVEYQAHARIQHTFSDAQIVGTPAAHIEGDTSPGSGWIRYNVTTDAGAMHQWHQLYSCCVANGGASGKIRVEDLVFSTPGGTGGTADVTFNVKVQGASGGCNGGSFEVAASLGVRQSFGVWDVDEPPCGGSGLSTGVFLGHDGPTISGQFVSPVFTVPLDVPVIFEFEAGAATGSYQTAPSVESYVSFPTPGSGMPVFNVVSGPAGITVNSAQLNVVNNVWGGPVVLSADAPPPPTGAGMLGAPHPNPVSGRTEFAISLPQPGHVALRVYDVRGRLVDIAHDGRLAAGTHRVAWDARRANAAAGVYLVKLSALGRDEARRVVVMH